MEIDHVKKGIRFLESVDPNELGLLFNGLATAVEIKAEENSYADYSCQLVAAGGRIRRAAEYF